MKDGRIVSVSVTPTAVILFERSSNPFQLPFPLEMYSEWAMRVLKGEPRSNGDDDPDGDGLTNREEFAIGTEPLDPTPSMPEWIRDENGEIIVTWPQSKTAAGVIILETGPTVGGPWTVNTTPPIKIGESDANEVFQIKIPAPNTPTYWNFRYYESSN